MTTVTPTWSRYSFDWRDHYARRTDRVLDADELAYGLRQLVPADDEPVIRSAVELKDRTDEQEALDREYRERQEGAEIVRLLREEDARRGRIWT